MHLQNIRFVLVNDRIPETWTFCASCSAYIVEEGGHIAPRYIRDPHTKLCYCAVACYYIDQRNAAQQ